MSARPPKGQATRTAERVAANTARAKAALGALARAHTLDDRLAAARALESAACQLRRALKEQDAMRASGEGHSDAE